jgi:group I intron endonuclease
MLIYKITNLINNKSYIGQTRRQSYRSRWNRHCSVKSKTAISLAIQKYGKENFDIKVVAVALSIEELNQLETRYIKEFNTLSPHGYNLNLGGDCRSVVTDEVRKKISNGNKGKILSDEARLKIGAASRNRVICDETRKKLSDAFKGRTISDAQKAQISATLTGRKTGPMSLESRDKNSLKKKNRPLSEEHKQKLSQIKRKPKTIYPLYKVKNLDTGEIWNSIREAAIANRLNPTSLAHWLRGKYPNRTRLVFLIDEILI